MSRSSRRRTGDAICEAFTAEARKWTPAGLGRWERIGEYTDGPVAEFTLALVTWEATGTDDDWEALKAAYDRALDMYQVAAADFEREREATS